MSIYSATRDIRMQDIDAAGIVFFARILEFCHDAYFDMLTDSGLNLAQSMASGPVLLPLVHAEADFKKPLVYGDRIRIDIVSTTEGGGSFTVDYAIYRTAEIETLCATASTSHAVVSRSTFKPTKAIPEEIRRGLHFADK